MFGSLFQEFPSLWLRFTSQWHLAMGICRIPSVIQAVMKVNPGLSWPPFSLAKCMPVSGKATWSSRSAKIGRCRTRLWTSWISYGITSSTAQGGGGSFKNEKPIGEVRCCGARMAERTHWWIERWLSVSPFLSLFLSVSLFRHLSTELPF